MKITRQDRGTRGDGGRLAWSYARTPELCALLRDRPVTLAPELNAVAGLAWRVYQTPLYMFVGGQPTLDDAGIVVTTPPAGQFKLVASPTPEHAPPAPDRFLNVRDDTHGPLGIVKRRYRTIQNDEAPRVLDELVASGHVRYEAAGALRGGAQLWWLARLCAADGSAAGEQLQTYLLLSNAHDGSSSTTVAVIAVHAGTETTLVWPVPRIARTLTLRHTPSPSGRALDAQRVLALARGYRDELERVVAEMQRTVVTARQFGSFLNALVPTPSARIRDGRVRNQRGITMAENAKALISLTYDHEEALASARGTLYGVVLACQIYSDHLTINRTTAEAIPDENRFRRLTSEANLGSLAFTRAIGLLP